MYDYFKQCAGAAIAAGKKLAAGHTDIAIAWPGGLHHAKKFEASGFCYINDIVLAILELLRSVTSCFESSQHCLKMLFYQQSAC